MRSSSSREPRHIRKGRSPASSIANDTFGEAQISSRHAHPFDVYSRSRWSRQYYRAGDQMMAVDIVTSGGSLTASKPRVLWRGHYLAGAGSSCGMAGPTSANYDVTPDGERFLMMEDASPNAECELLRVVSNWSLELKNPGAIQLKSSNVYPAPPLFGLNHVGSGARRVSQRFDR